SGPSAADSGYAWQHGLYWMASNVAVDSPLLLVVDDLQWCDAPSARALAFIARRLEGQPLGLIVATRPLDPAVTPEAAALVGDPAVQLLRPAPLTQAAVGRALSVLGDGAQVGDAARLADLDSVEVEVAMAGLASAGVVEPGGTVRFTHPILRSAIYDDLLLPERERLHQAAARILRER